ncbi:ITGA7 family protein [Megaselia abdita]
MKSVSLVVISATVFSIVSGFNLENRLPIWKYGPENSYFGYSIASHIMDEDSRTSKWILVGAPIGQNLQPGTNRSGALYKCPISRLTEDCEQVVTDGKRLDEDRTIQPPFTTEEIKDGQWLGVTVKSQGGTGGKAMVCAHRYIIKNFDSQYGQGLCYVLENDLELDDTYEPCKGRPTARQHEDYGFCQAGTSGDFLEDGTIIMGTPGPYTWRGAIYLTTVVGDYLARDKTIYYGEHSEISSPVDKYSYLGMSTTGGNFFDKTKMAYAAGAPRSNDTGQVVLFSKAKPRETLDLKMIINGEQFGSSFGYEMITADVNGDGKPDLIVAAPFYFAKNEGGAVYVYQNRDYKLPQDPTLKLTGPLESRFGSALANLGDINKDNCDDVAIGAPYEGNGVVYIFLGSPNGLSKKPSQKIHAADLGISKRPIKTFGSSLSGGVDLDDNSYPDLVIGSYDSSVVTALLSRPIISIKTRVNASDELRNIDPNETGCFVDPKSNLTCFTFQACCAVETYQLASGFRSKILRLRYTIEAETYAGLKKFSRVFFEKRSNVISKTKLINTDGKMYCYPETAYIKEGTRDIQSPLNFRLNYTIVEDDLPQFALDSLHPILNQTESAVTFTATFAKDCGDDDLCESHLDMITKMDLVEDRKDKKETWYSLMLGEKNEIRVNINITNRADSAYESQLFVVHQASVSYVNRESSVICNSFNKTVVFCNLGNPMRRDTNAIISLRFDPSGLEDEEKKLEFRVFANTTSTLIRDKPDHKLYVNIVKRADLSLNGWATPEQSFYGGEVKGESAMLTMDDIGSKVIHTYQIYNDGPWKAPLVSVTILWPFQVKNDKPQGKWLLYLEEEPTIERLDGRQGQGLCTVESQNVNPLKLAQVKNDNSTEGLQGPEIVQSAGFLTMRSNKSQFMKSRSNGESSLNRFRRDRAKVIRAEKLTDADGKKRDVVVMDCEKDTASCIKINCRIYNMPQKSEAYIQIKSRLWNSTLSGDYPAVDMVQIVSRASVMVPYTKNEYKSFEVDTRAYPELLDTVDTSTPIWVIILAVIGGLLVFALIAFIMWKCGFFRRKRPDLTLSGNLNKKSSETKPFL